MGDPAYCDDIDDDDSSDNELNAEYDETQASKFFETNDDFRVRSYNSGRINLEDDETQGFEWTKMFEKKKEDLVPRWKFLYVTLLLKPVYFCRFCLALQKGVLVE